MGLVNQNLEEITSQWKAILTDSMSVNTRSKRKIFLITSLIGFVILKLNLFPTQIEALGITFEPKNRLFMIAILFCALVYAAIGYSIYALSDFLIQRRLMNASTTGYYSEFVSGKPYFVEVIIYYLRMFFDYIFPIFFGAYSLIFFWVEMDFKQLINLLK